MDSKRQAIWVIHGGTDEKAHSQFVIEGYASLGWSKCGDLGLFPPDQKAFRERYLSHYPDDTLATAGIRAGELYSFVHEMKVGDSVIYPSRTDRLVRVGRVVGDYQYKSKHEIHSHVRKIKWRRRTVQRDGLPSKVRRALSGPRALYQLRKHASDVRKNLSL